MNFLEAVGKEWNVVIPVTMAILSAAILMWWMWSHVRSFVQWFMFIGGGVATCRFLFLCTEGLVNDSTLYIVGLLVVMFIFGLVRFPNWLEKMKQTAPGKSIMWLIGSVQETSKRILDKDFERTA